MARFAKRLLPKGEEEISQQYLPIRRICWSYMIALHPEHEATLTSNPEQPSSTVLPKWQAALRLPGWRYALTDHTASMTTDQVLRYLSNKIYPHLTTLWS